LRQLTQARGKKVFRELASGAKTDRSRLRRALDQLATGNMLMVTRLDRLARPTRDQLNTLTPITDRRTGFRSPGDAWADTTTAHGRLMLTVLDGPCEAQVLRPCETISHDRRTLRRHGQALGQGNRHQ